MALLFVELELLDGDEYVSLLRLGVTLRSYPELLLEGEVVLPL